MASNLDVNTYARITYNDDLTGCKYAIIVEATRELLLPYHVFKLWSLAANEKERHSILRSLLAVTVEFPDEICDAVDLKFIPNLVDEKILLDILI